MGDPADLKNPYERRQMGRYFLSSALFTRIAERALERASVDLNPVALPSRILLERDKLSKLYHHVSGEAWLQGWVSSRVSLLFI